MRCACATRKTITIAGFIIGLFGSATGFGANLYVSKSGSHASPFSTWAKAATNIQYAVSTASKGDTVWVTNGAYAVGYVAVGGDLTNTVFMNKAITLRSVNGPSVTTITGAKGLAHQRCVYMTNGAELIGFTLSGGGSLVSGDDIFDESGGGLLAFSGCLVSNCVIEHCFADLYGGGVYADGAVLKNCTIEDNEAWRGGGGYGGSYYDCDFYTNRADGAGAVGGGLYGATLASNSVFWKNEADGYAGGAFGSYLTDCQLFLNSAEKGAGVYGCKVENGTIQQNQAETDGGGAHGSELDDVIVVGNTAQDGGGMYACTGDMVSAYSNMASNNGGGAYACWLYDCDVFNNFAVNNGGGCALGSNINCSVYINIASNYGGGLFDSSGLRCDIYGNEGRLYGGGAYASSFSAGELVQCNFSNNLAGVTSSEAARGGGVYGYGLVQRCKIIGNTAAGYSFVEGGGLYGCYAENCLIVTNFADRRGLTYGGIGGGAHSCSLLYCTVAENQTSSGSGSSGGGLYGCAATNTVAYHNHAHTSSTNYANPLTMAYCCSAPLPAGVNNVDGDPDFGASYRPGPASSCIDAGRSTVVPEDLLGIGRPLDGNNDGLRFYDIGAYEYVNALADSDRDGMIDNWEIANSLDPIHDDADEDPDGDHYVNIDEYRAATRPRVSSSFLAITSMILNAASSSIGWQGGTEAYQVLEIGTDLSDDGEWTVVASNAPPTAEDESTGFDMSTVTGTVFRIRAGRE